VKTISSIKDLRHDRATYAGYVGFVPTMGALHAGHLSLIERAKAENDHVIVSVFVNPTQFNDPNDLEKYPRPVERDLALLRGAGVDIAFLPRPEEIYFDNYRFKVTENEFSKRLCGAHRPGHFDGVLTVVAKLFQLTLPDRAYFGEKDYQQLQLIKDMSDALFLDIEVVPCPTKRENDGLAMSSRNLRLTPEQREIAPRIYQVLRALSTRQMDAAGARRELEAAGFRVDYVEKHFDRWFAAAFLGDVRLIDNVAEAADG
jgi:pantoate--beta-alanine ligase